MPVSTRIQFGFTRRALPCGFWLCGDVDFFREVVKRELLLPSTTCIVCLTHVEILCSHLFIAIIIIKQLYEKSTQGPPTDPRQSCRAVRPRSSNRFGHLQPPMLLPMLLSNVPFLCTAASKADSCWFSAQIVASVLPRVSHQTPPQWATQALSLNTSVALAHHLSKALSRVQSAPSSRRLSQHHAVGRVTGPPFRDTLLYCLASRSIPNTPYLSLPSPTRKP